jgi:hypothetical protein
MVEEMMLERLLEPISFVTGRTLTEEGTDGFARVEGSPDFVVGFDGRPFGIELAEVRDVDDSVAYYGDPLQPAGAWPARRCQTGPRPCRRRRLPASGSGARPLLNPARRYGRRWLRDELRLAACRENRRRARPRD